MPSCYKLIFNNFIVDDLAHQRHAYRGFDPVRLCKVGLNGLNALTQIIQGKRYDVAKFFDAKSASHWPLLSFVPGRQESVISRACEMVVTVPGIEGFSISPLTIASARQGFAKDLCDEANIQTER